jgi:hypothetical protein
MIVLAQADSRAPFSRFVSPNFAELSQFDAYLCNYRHL